MKRKLMLMVAILALVSSASFAQLKYGGGLTLGTKSAIDDDGDAKMGFGINARVDYAINEKLSIVPGFTFYFPSSVEAYGEELKVSIWKLSADAHYTFAGDESLGFYGIGGLNYTSGKFKYEGEMGSWDTTESEIGLDLGVGALLNGRFFGEIIFDTAGNTDDGQLGITVGVLF